MQPGQQDCDIQDDDSYYFEDVIFLVENTRFKVPRHHFEQDSPVFRQLFSSLLAQREPLLFNGISKADFVGSFDNLPNSKDRPLPLKGVSKAEFVSFLKLICPKHFSRREELSSDDWASILKLSTLWQFDEARQQAIEKLTPSATDDPIQTILLAKAHDVPQWYSSGLKILVERPDPLTVEEVNRLGIELGLKVTQMRGKVEGFKIAESRFNQAVHSMSTAFTYDDFWDTVMTNSDDWLLRPISRPPSPPIISSPKPSTLESWDRTPLHEPPIALSDEPRSPPYSKPQSTYSSVGQPVTPQLPPVTPPPREGFGPGWILTPQPIKPSWVSSAICLGTVQSPNQEQYAPLPPAEQALTPVGLSPSPLPVIDTKGGKKGKKRK